MHFAEDYVVVECVDPETREPVPDGDLGVLVFTHLTREATPMIRYWSNDYARLVRGPCECGRTHARAVGGIVGRSDDLVVFKGAKFYPTQVEKVVRSFTELSDSRRELPIVRNGELEATNYFLGIPGRDEPELELTFNHDGRTYELGTAYGHIALVVADLDATLAALADQGIEPERPPYSVREDGSLLTFVRDPVNGYRIELIGARSE